MSNESNVELVYESPPPRAPARTWGAVAIMFGGLALVGLGGCFCIGIMSVVTHENLFTGQKKQLPITPTEGAFIGALSLLALASFGGALTLLILGTKALLRITRG
jgi:hypothetical protein